MGTQRGIFPQSWSFLHPPMVDIIREEGFWKVDQNLVEVVGYLLRQEMSPVVARKIKFTKTFGN